MEFPKQFAIGGIHDLEPAIHRSVKGNVACRHEGAAPHREFFVNLPDLFPCNWIPGHELATIAARPRIHVDIGADEWDASNVAGLGGLVVHAEVLVWHVEKLWFSATRPLAANPLRRVMRDRCLRCPCPEAEFCPHWE